MVNGIIELGPGCNLCRPLGHEGNVGSPFKVCELPASIGLIDIGQCDVAGATVIAGEDNQGVVRQPVFLESPSDTGNASIEGADHARVYPKMVVLDTVECIVVFLGRLKGIVNSPMREVEEKGTVAIVLDDLDSFFGVVVGEVAFWFEWLAVVERGHVPGVRPDHTRDTTFFALCVDDIGVVLG